MRTYLMLFVVISFTLSCLSDKKANEYDRVNKKSDSAYSYHIIDSLNLRKLYDSARWLLYQKQCRDTLKWSIACKETDIYTLGELGLDLDTLDVRGDTIDFKFCYSLLPKYGCKSPFVGNECIIKGIGVKVSSQKFLYYSTACNFDVTIDDVFEKKMVEKNELFIQYVNDRFDKLNSWFKDQVAKRKIIPK